MYSIILEINSDSGTITVGDIILCNNSNTGGYSIRGISTVKVDTERVLSVYNKGVAAPIYGKVLVG